MHKQTARSSKCKINFSPSILIQGTNHSQACTPPIYSTARRSVSCSDMCLLYNCLGLFMHTMYAGRVRKRNNKMCQSSRWGTNSFSPRQPPQMLSLSPLQLPPPIQQLWHSNIQARFQWQPALGLWAPVHACVPAVMCTYEMIRGPEWDGSCQTFMGDSSSFAEAIVLPASEANAVGKPLTW